MSRGGERSVFACMEEGLRHGGWLPLSVRRPVFRSRHQPWCNHFVPLEDRNADAQAANLQVGPQLVGIMALVALPPFGRQKF